MRHRYCYLYLFHILFLLCSCSSRQQDHVRQSTATDAVYTDSTTVATLPSPARSESSRQQKSRTALCLDSLGFVNIAEADSTIAVDLMYTRAENFTGTILYEDLKEAYLHPEAMESLSRAQRLLKERHPGYSLIIYDAARPMSVQQKMWDVVKGTPKYIYVSNPARGGGLHNYGLAVDISILDEEGNPLPMGTPVDHLGREAHITEEARLVAQGKITEAERENRLLLRQVMKEAGFRPLPSEWWHFNRVSRQTAKEKYRLIP
ncbi:M15 family metallopeptidase [Bacteroides sp.]|uniref:M15 family metallopeptidase n=1 Tax=Bacteroides sp. TaxID=29523 RepID=UPI003AB6B4E8